MKLALSILTLSSILTSAEASLVILGVIDGTLPGGTPKAIVLEATASIADLSAYGVGSANNGEGTDGAEFTLPMASIVSGQHIIVASTPITSGGIPRSSADFFTTNYPNGDFLIYQSGDANINGDDAIELFFNAAVIDTYGDVNVDGNGQVWEYTDGFAVRTGGSAGAFNPANYAFNSQSLDGLTESQQAAALDSTFGFGTPKIPEPSSALLSLFGLGSLLLRRRRVG